MGRFSIALDQWIFSTLQPGFHLACVKLRPRRAALTRRGGWPCGGSATLTVFSVFSCHSRRVSTPRHGLKFTSLPGFFPSRSVVRRFFKKTDSTGVQPVALQPVAHRYGRCAKSWTVPDRRIDVWANQTHKSASLTGLDSPLFGGTTINSIHGRHDGETGWNRMIGCSTV